MKGKTMVLYGVGNAVLRDVNNPSNILAMTKLTDLTISTTANEERIFGGDSPYPMATFPRDKAITVTAAEAKFDMKVLEVSQGATEKDGVGRIMTFVDNFDISGDVDLLYEPLPNTVLIPGFTAAADADSLAEGQFFVDTENNKIVFHQDDYGKSVNLVYDYLAGVGAVAFDIMKDTLSKPFTFIHTVPVYDTENNIVARAQLTIYRAKANNNFEFNLQPQTAFAPSLELEALDSKRADGKLWDYVIDPVV